jgi:hypothetical protein
MLARNMVTLVVPLTVVVLFSSSVHAQVVAKGSAYDCHHYTSDGGLAEQLLSSVARRSQ